MSLILQDKPKPTVKIYYNDYDGSIIGVSTSADSFQTNMVEVPWEEGKGLLSGEKSPDQYFINIHSLRKDLVKRNLVQIYGHGNNIEYVDLLDHSKPGSFAKYHIEFVSWHPPLDIWNAFINNSTRDWIKKNNITLVVTEYKNPLKVLVSDLLYDNIVGSKNFSVYVEQRYMNDISCGCISEGTLRWPKR